MSNVKIVERLNQISLCFFSSTYILSYCININVLFSATAFLIWLITACRVDKGFLFQSHRYIKFMGLFVLIEYIYFVFVGNNLYPELIKLLLAYIWFLILYFYSRNRGLLKAPLLVMLFMYAISSYNTLIGNIMYPNASRFMASHLADDNGMRETYNMMHIGGYAFIYSLVFIMMPVIYASRQIRGIWSKLNWLFIGLIIATLVIGSYFISLILGTVMVVLSISLNTRKTLFISILAILVLLVFKEDILKGFIAIGEFIDSDALKLHAYQLLQNDNGLDDSSGGRSGLYVGAIRNILNHPFWGKMEGGYFFDSGHSEILEIYERFGLLGIPYYIFYYYVHKDTKEMFASSKIQYFYSIYYSLFILFLCVDVFRNSEPLPIAVYFIGPSFFLLSDYIESKHRNNNTLR